LFLTWRNRILKLNLQQYFEFEVVTLVLNRN